MRRREHPPRPYSTPHVGSGSSVARPRSNTPNEPSCELRDEFTLERLRPTFDLEDQLHGFDILIDEIEPSLPREILEAFAVGSLGRPMAGFDDSRSLHESAHESALACVGAGSLHASAASRCAKCHRRRLMVWSVVSSAVDGPTARRTRAGGPRANPTGV